MPHFAENQTPFVPATAGTQEPRGRGPWIPACAGKGICLDLRHITPKAEITPSDLEQAVKKSAAAIPKRGTVLLTQRTGRVG